MVEPLLSHGLVEEVKLNQLNGWGENIGGDILGESKYRMMLKPVVNELPVGQKWTTLNLSKSNKLEEISKVYTGKSVENRNVLTLQAISLRHQGFTDTHIDRLWDEGNADLAVLAEDGKSEEVTLVLGTCSYHELLAFVSGDVEGLVNPNGVLVSLEAVTKDNKLIFAKRRNVSTGQNKIGIIGGTYDYSVNEKVPEPSDVAYEEILEELGIGREDVNVRPITLLEDQWRRPVYFCRARLNLTSNQIEETWKKSSSAQSEHSQLYFVDNDLDGLLKFAREHSPREFHPPADLIFQYALVQAINERRSVELDRVAGGTTSPI